MTNINDLHVNDFIIWLKPWMEDALIKEAEYNALDAIYGDDDYGTHLYNLAKDVFDKDIFENSQTAKELLNNIGSLTKENSTSISSTLFARAFIDMSETVEERDNLGQVLLTGAISIQNNGGTQLGDKTILDIWLPASKALIDDELSHHYINSLLRDVTFMEAKYTNTAVDAESTVGEMDPGAFATAEMFRYILAAAKINQQK